MRKFDSMAVLPELRKGETTPESGMAPSAPPEMSSISKAMSEPSPTPKNVAYSSGALRAMRNAAEIKMVKSRQMQMTPGRPHSSAIEARTKSVWPAGIRLGSPQPGPEPIGAASSERP